MADVTAAGVLGRRVGVGGRSPRVEAFDDPDLKSLVGRVVRQWPVEQRSAYFDAVDLRLWELGITLRHRLGEGPASGLWTLKLPTLPGESGPGGAPGGLVARPELSWPGTRDAVPEPAQAIVAAVTRRARLGLTRHR